MSKRPATWPVARAVGWVTFLEIIRDKVLYNILVISGMLMLAGFLASRLSFVRPDRLVLDFGISAVTLSSVIIAIFTGSTLIGREFDRRTIYVALAHPISRLQFVIGKYFGICIIIAVNWLLLSGAYLLILGSTSDPFFENFQPTLFIALFLILVQGLLVSSIAMLFSSFSTTSLSVIMTLGIYLVGNNITQLRLLAAQIRSPLASAALNGAALIFPNMEYFNLGLKVTYSLPVPAIQVLGAVVYASFLVLFNLFLGGVLIRMRESA